MRRMVLLGLLTGLLVGCSSANDKVGEIVRDKYWNVAPGVIPIVLATPPVHTILFNSCKDELFMSDSKRAQCNLNHKIHGTTAPWDRNAAEARVMAYQPGELQCTRTLGGVPDCRVISGTPRPVTLIAPNMGAN